ncbi:MAG: DNA polymerase I [Fimbriimonas sp.]|nr:DNA polymerase I [Fimbriimonas sp.]
MGNRRLVIIDGYSLLYRAFFATRYMSTTDGRPTNALYGFTSMLFTLLEKVRPSAVVVALDAPGKTFRHAEYEAYKGTRKETQEELRVQLKAARQFISALGIPSVEVTGFEADDVVGTISLKAEENGYDTTIVTGDLDALQLVDTCVSVLTMKQGVTDTVTYGPEQVVERYGFGPEYIPDYKALKGDTSDNIPGVPGIGEKGASDIIQRFGAIEQLLARFEELDAKYQKRIEGNEDQMRQSKYLATIIRDVPLEYDFEPFVLTKPQMDAAIAMLESFEFRSHARRAPIVLGGYLEGAKEADKDAPVVEVEAEKLEIELAEIEAYAAIEAFVGAKPFAIYFQAPPTRTDLFEESNRKAFIAIGSQVREVPEQEAIRLLESRPEAAILHDAKPVYRRMDKRIGKPRFDTLLAGYVLRSERSAYALRDLVQGYLDVAPPTSAGELASALYLLGETLSERIEKESQTRVLQEIELPLVPILAEMEKLGIRTDRTQLKEFSKSLEVTIDLTTQKIYELAGTTFTIGSPKQLGEVLFEKLQIPGAQKTKTGYATGVEVLSLIAPQYEIAQEVLNWRELTKLKSTYADSLEKLIQADGRIHTTYNQAVAATGRLSSNDPNLQNIPIRTELGRGIRKAFTAGSGYRLASLDYSQIELRVLAHLCGEPALVDAFNRHVDVHTVTAQQMFGLGNGDATKEQRRMAKMLNYAVLYGVTEFGLAQQLGGGFSIAEAKELIRLYNERFPTVADFTKSIVGEARSKGFTTTLCGRRRYFPDIHAPKIMERKYAERQAMNAPIQGAAADMLKLAMIKVDAQIRGSSTRMLLNVHDELVFEIPTGEEGVLVPIRSDMEQALPLNVPVEVDAKIGADWNDMVPV